MRHVISGNDWNRTARFWNSNEPAGIVESKSFNSVILIFFFFTKKLTLHGETREILTSYKGQVMRFSASIAY